MHFSYWKKNCFCKNILCHGESVLVSKVWSVLELCQIILTNDSENV